VRHVYPADIRTVAIRATQLTYGGCEDTHGERLPAPRRLLGSPERQCFILPTWIVSAIRWAPGDDCAGALAGAAGAENALSGGRYSWSTTRSNGFPLLLFHHGRRLARRCELFGRRAAVEGGCGLASGHHPTLRRLVVPIPTAAIARSRDRPSNWDLIQRHRSHGKHIDFMGLPAGGGASASTPWRRPGGGAPQRRSGHASTRRAATDESGQPHPG